MVLCFAWRKLVEEVCGDRKVKLGMRTAFSVPHLVSIITYSKYRAYRFIGHPSKSTMALPLTSAHSCQTLVSSGNGSLNRGGSSFRDE